MGNVRGGCWGWKQEMEDNINTALGVADEYIFSRGWETPLSFLVKPVRWGPGLLV